MLSLRSIAGSYLNSYICIYVKQTNVNLEQHLSYHKKDINIVYYKFRLY